MLAFSSASRGARRAGQRSGAGPWRSRLADSPAGEVSVGFCPRFLPRSFLRLFFSGRGRRGTVASCMCVCVSQALPLQQWLCRRSCIPRTGGQHPVPLPAPVPGWWLRDISISRVSLAAPGAGGDPMARLPRLRSVFARRMPKSSSILPDLATGSAQVMNYPESFCTACQLSCTQRKPFRPRRRGRGQTDGCVQPIFGASTLPPEQRD